jgi:hypothetical protein
MSMNWHPMSSIDPTIALHAPDIVLLKLSPLTEKPSRFLPIYFSEDVIAQKNRPSVLSVLLIGGKSL